MVEEADFTDNYVRKLKSIFTKQPDPEDAYKMKQYMRNKFEFFGIKATKRRKISRHLMRKENRPSREELEPVVKRLWQLPEREFQYFAWELIERYKKDFREDDIELFVYMITHKSWWDTVDHTAKKLVGPYMQKFPEERDKYLENWVDSDNIWLQRTTLLFQLGYKEETDIELLFDLIGRLKDIDEFFIQKAIGWALREYSKIDPEVVGDFINNNGLSSLAEREGMKAIRRQK